MSFHKNFVILVYLRFYRFLFSFHSITKLVLLLFEEKYNYKILMFLMNSLMFNWLAWHTVFDQILNFLLLPLFVVLFAVV